MDLKTLNCFVAVAEELHFRRAAARLNMTQPSLTIRIQTLEREIGAKLLDRDRRSVRLTPPGAAFLEHARSAVQSGKEAVVSARRAATGDIGHLRFGFTGLTSYAGMPELVQLFKRSHPDVVIELVQMNTADLEIALFKDEIDIALVHPPLSRPELTLTSLQPDLLVAAVPSSHELARLSSIPFDRLAGEPFLICPRNAAPFLYDQIILACRRAGFSPSIVQEVTYMTTLIGLVAAGIGCGLVTHSLQVIQRPGVTYRPLEGKHRLELATALAWRAEAISPVAQRLLDVAASTFSGHIASARSATGKRVGRSTRRDAKINGVNR